MTVYKERKRDSEKKVNYWKSDGDWEKNTKNEQMNERKKEWQNKSGGIERSYNFSRYCKRLNSIVRNHEITLIACVVSDRRLINVFQETAFRVWRTRDDVEVGDRRRWKCDWGRVCDCKDSQGWVGGEEEITGKNK